MHQRGVQQLMQHNPSYLVKRTVIDKPGIVPNRTIIGTGSRNILIKAMLHEQT
jgi:hypothetical protein